MRLFLIISLLFTNLLFSQLSNKHWLPPLHGRVNSDVSDHYLYLSTPEPIAFNVTIKRGDGTLLPGSPFSISQGNPVTIAIGNSQPSDMFVTLSDVNIVTNSGGLVLEATKDFYATFKVRAQNHAEILVSKGIPGIGTQFRLGSLPQNNTSAIRNFVSSFMATQDNTTVTVSDYNVLVEFATPTGNLSAPSQTFVLNKGESVVLSGYSSIASNLTGFVGALLESDKPIAVSTGNALGGMLDQNSGQDFNLDQIVSYEQIGSEYIVVKGNGSPNSERPLVIATVDNTQVFINGSATPAATLNAGDYYLVPSFNYQGTNNQNMYITSNNDIYLYQILAGSQSDATTGLNFIPPLSCFFQKSVDLIPSIDTIGTNAYFTDILVLTATGSTITVNGNPTIALPEPVLGTIEWVTYRIAGFTGNVVVESTGPLAVGIFGTNGSAVGFSGYYSGFGSEPRDTDVTVCSNVLTNLLDEIDGNPEPNGTWLPALSSGGNIFNPNIDLPGVYNYSYTGDCELVDVDITVTIEQAPFAGNDTNVTFCITDPILNLFTLLGSGVTTGGTWSPAMASGTGEYNPAIDAAGVYTYTIEASEVCDEETATVTIIKNNSPLINTISAYEICDDDFDGNDTNGFAIFNLASKTTEILDGQTGIVVTYHANQANADNNLLPLTNYYSNSQLVYARLTNTTTNCFVVTSFNLVVNSLPVIDLIVDLKQCDTNTDAIADFNLTFANLLISADTTLNYSYFTTQANAQSNTSPITNSANYTSPNNGTVWARVTNSNTCFRVSRVNLLVSTTTPVNGIQLTQCDDFINNNDPSNDGFDYFDLTEATTGILAQFPPNQNLQVSYYENQNNASAGLNSITNLSNYRNTTANNQFVWIRIDSAINNECFGLGQFVELIVNPLPNFDLGTDFKVCLNPINGSGSQTINATPVTSGNYTYSWTPINPTTNSSGGQSAIYTVTQSGTYSVVVTNTNTDCNNSDTVTATVSSLPAAVSAVLITPLFSPGTASIEALPVAGFGIYEYSIDNGLNWQISPIFSGLPNGNYIILVRDLERCGIKQTQSVLTVTYPVYFTPNGDGYNEFWNISGLLDSYKGKLFIFDRYGKLIKEIKPSGLGWDGTFNGQPLPATDYWFKIEYIENNQLKEFKSHFSLKR
jgi:gliding motility-associated-like protein